MLIIDLEKFSLYSKNEIVNDNGNLQYWSQPDFSYKHRVHIYDKDSNEIGYVQYKILSTQDTINYFDKEDKEISISNLTVKNKSGEWDYSIYKDNEQIASLNSKDNKVYIEINNDLEADKCLLLIFGLAEEENNK